MLEFTTTRHNPLIDPQLAVWSWEIPVYLFLGGIVAGMMVLGGLALRRLARGDDARSFFSLHTPLLAFVLLNLGMLALLLDLAHRWNVWRIYLTFQPTAPMSWGSWVLIIVYGVLLVSALIRLPETWPALARRVPPLAPLSQALLARPGRLAALAWANIVLGVALGIYTGILLSTLGARALWNSALLGPLFLASGLSAGAALLRLLPLSSEERSAAARWDLWAIGAEIVLLVLVFVGLGTNGATGAQGLHLILGGRFTALFWSFVVGAGLLLPLLFEVLEHRLDLRPSALVPTFVLLGGFALRWVFVMGGQAH